MWFEVFASGLQTSSNGISRDYSNEDLEKIAFEYNALVEKDKNKMAPAVKGHPKTDEPAIGWVEKLARRGDKLVADINFNSSDFAEELQNGSFKNISISLFDDFKLKHIGFLGAANPAVTGLRKFDYSIDKDDQNFEKLKTENDLLKDKLKQLEKEKRIEDFRNYANDLVKQNQSKIKPSQVADIVDLLELTHNKDIEISDFSQTENFTFSNKLKNILESETLVDLTNQVINDYSFINQNNFNSKNFNEERLDIHNKAISLQNCDPMLSYEEAVLRAMSFIH